MIILIVVLKKLTNIFKEMSHNIDFQRSKKNSQPLKCRRLKKYISQTLSTISEKKEKGKKEKEKKEKESKEKEKQKQ